MNIIYNKSLLKASSFWQRVTRTVGVFALLMGMATMSMAQNSICAGESYTLKAQSGLTNYQWYTISAVPDTVAIGGATDSNYVATMAGKYYYTAQDGNMCAVTLCNPLEIVPGNCNICLGNYVFNDVNHDGVQGATEVGVSGVTVSLLNGTTNAILATITTDAYGHYQFCGLTPGDYKVKFSVPTNYVFTMQNTPDDISDSDPSPISGITDVYTLAYGDSNMTVDAGIYQPLPNTATVGNRVWFDVDGDGVQDVLEGGVSGITVSLYACSNLGAPVMTTLTDANGFYLFENVVPGSYAVGVTLPIGMLFTTQNGSVSDAVNSDVNPQNERTACFTVNAGDNLLYVDAGIVTKPTGSISIGDKVWRDSNHDGIQDGTETGMANITVTLYGPDGTTVIGTTVTDGLGNYIFNGYPAGCYVIGFSDLPLNYVFSPSNVGSDSTKNSDADATTGKTNVICLTNGQNNPTIDAGIYNSQLLVPNNNSIGNLVWYDENRDGIQDPNEYGYPGVVVTLYDCATNAIVATTTTNASGNYIFDGIANGSYYVGFGFVPGYQFTAMNSDVAGVIGANNSDANPSSGMTACVTVSGGDNLTTIDAGIYPGSNRNATSSLGDIVWTDVNHNGLQDAGEPGVPNVTVTLFEDDGTTVIATTVTDGLGNYIFTNLDGGSYVVGFTNLPVGYSFTPQSGLIDDEDNSDANVVSGKTDIITLGAGEDKMSVDAGLQAPANTVCLGDYVWIDLNQNGTQDANEPAVPGVTVKLYDNATNNVLQVATTNSKGNYMFCGLTNGATYSVGFENLPVGFTFTNSNGALNVTDNSDANPSTGRTTTVTLGASDDLTIDAGIYSPTTAVVGNYVWYDEDADGIQDANEAPISGVLVTLYDNTSTSVASAVTDANGGYLFTNVVPGTYSIGFEGYPVTLVPTTKGSNATADDDSNVDPSTGMTDAFTVAAGSSNLTLDAGFKANPVAGLGNYVWIDADKDGVQDANEASLSGVVVTLYEADGITEVAKAITDGNGAYSFPNLVVGNYVVGFSNLPVGYTRTIQNGPLNDATNSDISTGNKTAVVTLTAGQYNPNIDAGFYKGFPVPVDLSKFEAIGQDCFVTLRWTTATEKNSSHFDILRTSTKGNLTEKIAQVDSKGDSDVEVNYSFIDRNINNDTYLYQLRIVDQDGTHWLSKIESVILNCTPSIDKISVYPNPSNGQVNVRIVSEEEDTYTIRILDAVGRMVYQTETEVNNTTKVINMDVRSLSSGTYVVEVVGFYGTQQFKIQLSK